MTTLQCFYNSSKYFGLNVNIFYMEKKKRRELTSILILAIANSVRLFNCLVLQLPMLCLSQGPHSNRIVKFPVFPVQAQIFPVQILFTDTFSFFFKSQTWVNKIYCVKAISKFLALPNQGIFVSQFLCSGDPVKCTECIPPANVSFL